MLKGKWLKCTCETYSAKKQNKKNILSSDCICSEVAVQATSGGRREERGRCPCESAGVSQVSPTVRHIMRMTRTTATHPPIRSTFWMKEREDGGGGTRR